MVATCFACQAKHAKDRDIDGPPPLKSPMGTRKNVLDIAPPDSDNTIPLLSPLQASLDRYIAMQLHSPPPPDLEDGSVVEVRRIVVRRFRGTKTKEIVRRMVLRHIHGRRTMDFVTKHSSPRV